MTTNCIRRFPAAPVKAAPAAAAAAKLVVAVAGGPVLRPVAAAAAVRRGVGGGLAVAVVVAVVVAVAAIEAAEAVASVRGGDVAVLVIAGAGSAAEKVLLDGRPSHLGLLLSHSANREEIHHIPVIYCYSFTTDLTPTSERPRLFMCACILSSNCITGSVNETPYRKRRETKRQPGLASCSQQQGCRSVSLHFP